MGSWIRAPAVAWPGATLDTPQQCPGSSCCVPCPQAGTNPLLWAAVKMTPLTTRITAGALLAVPSWSCAWQGLSESSSPSAYPFASPIGSQHSLVFVLSHANISSPYILVTVCGFALSLCLAMCVGVDGINFMKSQHMPRTAGAVETSSG